ncbi:MAG: hypothetical protein K2F78_08950, partial [Muribaculaceae bacterium]|nr:hypothetical protein [Muribaculaceae bacterium]
TPVGGRENNGAMTSLSSQGRLCFETVTRRNALRRTTTRMSSLHLAAVAGAMTSLSSQVACVLRP